MPANNITIANKAIAIHQPPVLNNVTYHDILNKPYNQLIANPTAPNFIIRKVLTLNTNKTNCFLYYTKIITMKLYKWADTTYKWVVIDNKRSLLCNFSIIFKPITL